MSREDYTAHFGAAEQICLRVFRLSYDVFGRGSQLERSGKMPADAGVFLRGRMHPLVESGEHAAPLRIVFDDHEAEEVASRFQTRAHGIVAREHPVEDESHVVGFEKLGDGQGAENFSAYHSGWA